MNLTKIKRSCIHDNATPQPSKGKGEITMQLTKEQFKKVRTDLQYTQNELAKLLGVDTISVSRYENGHREISKTISILLHRIYQDEK